MSDRRGVLCAVGLFLLAPYIGEYVLGNQPVTALPQILLLAPMYGGGALIIREVGRRTRAGWPVMVALALAYALVEEGLIDQMIFNPAYLGLGSFDGYAAIPGLGVSATLTLDSLALHAIGSTCVPIAIVEAFDRDESEPWLRRAGLGVVIAVFVLGSTSLAVLQTLQFHFVGTVAQFGVTTAVSVGLIVVAARQAPHGRHAQTPPPARSPRTIGFAAFAVTTCFWLIDMLVPSVASAWAAVAGGSLVLAAGTVLLVMESREDGVGATGSPLQPGRCPHTSGWRSSTPFSSEWRPCSAWSATSFSGPALSGCWSPPPALTGDGPRPARRPDEELVRDNGGQTQQLAVT